MIVIKWITVDVHYKKVEQNKADKERKRLEKLGYEYQNTDESGAKDCDYCDQYIKSIKSRTLK